MISFKRADHFHICVPPEKLEEAKAFYTEVIGLELLARPDHLFSSAGYWFNIGDVQLHIGVEQELRRSIRHMAMEVLGLDAARIYLEENRVEIVEEPVIPGRSVSLL